VTPLARLKQFAKVPVQTKKPKAKAEPETFTYKGETYACPSPATEAISGFEHSSRGKAWRAYCNSRA
jgi:hypothetical protein